MREVVFVDFARTAFGNRGGSLRTFSSCTLAAECLKGLVKKSEIWERGGEHAVDAIFLGSANRSKDSVSPARYSALLAGFPVETEAHQVEMQCGSAITSINHAAFQIALGYTDVAIAGGMESASTKPAFLSTTTDPYKGMPPQWLTMRLAPEDEQNISMIQVADLMAEKWGITRTQCDEFALTSQQRLDAAYKSGLIGPEIVPLTIPATRKTPEIIVDKDEFPKPNSTMEGLSGLRAVNDGVTTAGNASGINDGAAFVLMMSAEKAKELGYTPYARWVMGADIGVEPKYMGIGPAFSNAKALKLAGLTAADMDVWECNEAFAAQNLAVVKELEHLTGHAIDMAKWNPNGGAIAIGHPIGASGARIIVTLLHEMEKRPDVKRGLATLCIGGGLGVTTIFEKC